MLNHLSIPAACFTHPEISMVGLTEVTLTLDTFSGLLSLNRLTVTLYDL